MGGIANQLRTYQILTQENQNEHLLELFQPLRSQLEQGDGLQISQILEALKSLGQAAAEDLGCNKVTQCPASNLNSIFDNQEKSCKESLVLRKYK